MAIMRISRSGGEPEKLIEANGAHFLAVLNERTLLFIARADDRSGPWLWALDIASRQVRRLNPGMNPITSVSASGDGRRVLLTVSNPSAALWRVPLVPGRTATEADVQPYPIKSESGRSLAPRFGKASLFFLSSRGGDDGLWQMQGREAREIPKDANVVLTEPAAVSPKDERVALVAYNKQDGKRRLMILSAGGSEPPHAVTSIDIKGAANQGAVDWSPDGKYIVAGGVREDGVTGLFRIPVNGGKPDLLVEGTATNPVWSPSDDLIVYAGRFERGQVTLFGVRPSDRTPVEIRHLVEEKDVPVRVRPGGYRFHPDGKLVFVPTTSSPDFWLLDLATRKSTAIATLSDSHGRQITFDISRDGRSIVFDRMPENSDIWLIEVPKTASAQDSGRRSSR
jgi:Tol biopolymer transport system component